MEKSENKQKKTKKKQAQVRTNRRTDLNLITNGDYFRYFKIKGLHRYYDLYKSVGNYNESTNIELKKLLRSLLIQTNLNISQLNRKQDKLFTSYKNLDDIKHRIFYTEYQQQLEYLKESLKNNDKYKFRSEKSMLDLDIYKKAKSNLKANLAKRFQFDDEFGSVTDVRCSTPAPQNKRQDSTLLKELSTADRQLFSNVLHSDKSVDFKLPKLLSPSNFEKILKAEKYSISNLVANKRLSLVVVSKKQEKNIVHAYKLDSEQNLIEIDPPKRKDFRLNMDKIKQNRIQKHLETEREKLFSYGSQIKDFFSENPVLVDDSKLNKTK